MQRQHRIAYQPALDGLRGLAVALVLVFHGGFAWMRGGYIGVSVFFTLSGYLITALLLAEVESTTPLRRRRGALAPVRVDIAGFYARRIRRLLPASLLCLTAVAIGAAWGAFRVVDGLVGQIVASAAQVENWFALARDTSYTELLTGVPSPVDHFWSLSIEEQFYWVWPWFFLFVVRRWSSPRARFAVVAGVTGVALVAAPLIAWQWGPDAAYWATPARVGEILTGATLAFAMRVWTLRPSRSLGPMALLAIITAAVLLPSDSGPAFGGWLGFGSLLSVALIAGIQVPGVAQSLLSTGPLVGLGRISYGVYLAHWPIFLVLDHQRTGLDGVVLFAVRIAATLAAAMASFVLLEQPIRRGGFRRPRAQRPYVVLVGLAATVGVAMVAVVAVPRPRAFGASAESQAAVSIAPDAEVGQLAVSRTPINARSDTPDPSDPTEPAEPAELATEMTTPTPTTLSGPNPALVAQIRPDAQPGYTWSVTTTVPSQLPTPSRPIRVLVVGDSTAMALGDGLVAFANENPELLQVDVIASPFCGFVDSLPDQSDEVVKGCEIQERALTERMSKGVPDIVVVLISRNDQIPRQFVADERPVKPADYRDEIETGYRAFTAEVLANRDIRVLWVLPAPPANWWLGFYRSDHLRYPQVDYEPQLTTIEDLVAENPTRMATVNLDDLLGPEEASGDHTWRPDGLHLEPEPAADVVAQQTWPAIVDLALS